VKPNYSILELVFAGESVVRSSCFAQVCTSKEPAKQAAPARSPGWSVADPGKYRPGVFRACEAGGGWRIQRRFRTPPPASRAPLITTTRPGFRYAPPGATCQRLLRRLEEQRKNRSPPARVWVELRLQTPGQPRGGCAYGCSWVSKRFYRTNTSLRRHRKAIWVRASNPERIILI